MKQVNLWITSGPPASGKSTAIKNFFAFEPDVVVVSRDVIRFRYLDTNPTVNYFSFEKQVYKDFINDIKMAIQDGHTNVVADATHLNERSRNKLINSIGYPWLFAYNANLNYIVMNTSLEECLRRNAFRVGRTRVPDKTICDMYENYKKPTFNEIYIPNRIYYFNEDGTVEILKRKK